MQTTTERPVAPQAGADAAAPAEARATPAPAESPAAPRITWNRVVALIMGQGVSLTGDYALLVGMTWTAVRLGGTAAVTALLLVSTIPRSLTLLLGGPIADRIGSRFVLLRTVTGRVLLLAAGAVLVSQVHALWCLLAIGAIEGVLLGLGSPAYGSIMPTLMDDDQLARANSLNGTVLRLTPILGTPFGAWLIASGRLWASLAVVAFTCTTALGSLLYVTRGMPLPQAPAKPAGGADERAGGRRGALRSSGDGLRLLAADARLRWLFVSAFFLDLAFGWPLEVALPLLVKQRGWSVETIGEVVAVFSTGALAAGAAGVFLADRLSMRVRLVVTGVGIAAGIGLMSLMPSVPTLAASGFAVGLMCGLNGPAIVTSYQQAAPREQIGVAMSMLTLANVGTGPVSVALFGTLALLLGLQTTWLLCGLVALVGPVAALLALRHPSRRGAEPAQAMPAPAEATAGAAI